MSLWSKIKSGFWITVKYGKELDKPAKWIGKIPTKVTWIASISMFAVDAIFDVVWKNRPEKMRLKKNGNPKANA